MNYNFEDIILCNLGISEEEVKGIVDLAVGPLAKSLSSLSDNKQEADFLSEFLSEFYLF